MPDHNQQHSRRPHYHRGRRGPDRRGGDRRPQGQPPAAENAPKDNLDVEQIMREIRSRISDRHNLDLTHQQIQELAARRLEAILDPRSVSPTLMDQLRRAAGLPADAPAPVAKSEASFNESALYESPSGLVRLLRRLLNPLLKLLLNPQAVSEALNGQSRAIDAAAAREAAERRRQAEWNALHFEILRRLVVSLARAEIDAQQLTQRVESLAAKVDFNERRVRGLEQTQHLARPTGRSEAVPASPPTPVQPAPRDTTTRSEGQAPDHAPGDGSAGESRRRRRRRRGRRSGGPMRELSGPPVGGSAPTGPADQVVDGSDADDFPDDEQDGGIGESESAPDAGEPADLVPASADAVSSDVAAVDAVAAEAVHAPEPDTSGNGAPEPPHDDRALPDSSRTEG
jgi:hypothetical protein